MVNNTTALWSAQRDLDNYWRQVYADAKFMWSGANAWNANMEDVKRRIDELAENGRLGIAVVNGFVSENGAQFPFGPDKWKSIHHTLWDAVSAQANINGRAASIWTDFLVPTAKDVSSEIDKVKDTVSDVGEKLDFITSPAGMLLIFGILVVVLVLKIA